LDVRQGGNLKGAWSKKKRVFEAGDKFFVRGDDMLCRSEVKETKLMSTKGVGVSSSLIFDSVEKQVCVSALIFVNGEADGDEISVDENSDDGVGETNSGDVAKVI